MTGFPVPVPGWFHVGSKIVVNAGIPSAEAVGHPLVAYLQNIIPAGIPSLEAVGTPGILRGAVILRPTGIPSAEAFGTLINQNGDFATDLSHWYTTPGRTIWDGTDGHDALGSVKIIGNGIDYASLQAEDIPALPGQSVSLSAWIKAPGVTSSPGTGGYVWTATQDASHNLIEFGPGAGFINTNVPVNWTKFVIPAYVLPAGTAYLIIGCNVDGSVVGNVWFDDVALVRSDVKLTYFVAPTGIPSAAAFGVPTVVPGVTTLIPSGIASEEAFGTPLLTSVVKPTGIPSEEVFGTPTVTRGPVTVLASGIASAEAFGVPVVTAPLTVLFDAVGAGGSAVTTFNMNITHTATPGTPVITYVALTNQAGVMSIGASYAGQTMKLENSIYLGTASGFYSWLLCFSYPTALSGPQTIAFSTGYSSYLKAGSLSYLNANIWGTVATNGPISSAAPAIAGVPSALRHMVCNCLYPPAGTVPVSGYNQTPRWNVVTGGWAPVAMLLGDAPGAAPNVSFQGTANVAGNWGAMGLDLWNAPVYPVGTPAAVLGQSATLPPHQVGDLIVVCAIDVSSITGVIKPAAGGTVPAWVDIEQFQSGSGSIRIAQFKATATNHTSGTWGTASNTWFMAIVIRGQNPVTPIGGHNTGGSYPNSSANSLAPSIPLGKNDGSSLILQFHHIYSTSFPATAPAGYTRRVMETTYGRVLINTKDDSTTDGAVAQAATAADWVFGSQIEILAPGSSPPPATANLIGTTVATASPMSVALPPHQVGDLIVLAVSDVASNGPPGKPAAGGTVPAWVDIDANTGAGTICLRTVYCVATANNHTSGSWSGNGYIAAAVIRGQKAGSPIGGHAEAGGTSTTGPVLPAITLSNNDGSSLILCFPASRAVQLDVSPPGYVRRNYSADNRFGPNTKDVSTTAGAVTFPLLSATSTSWRAAQIEILR